MARYDAPLPDWARAIYALIALLTGGAGLGLFGAPEYVAPLWFWPLTLLLARMTAAWLIGVSSAVTLVLLDNNLRRIPIVALTLIVYALLQLVVLLRFAGAVQWAQPSAWLWTALLLLLLLTNIWAWCASRLNVKRM